MTPNTGVGILARGVVAMCLGLVANQAFAQTPSSDTATYRERVTLSPGASPAVATQQDVSQVDTAGQPFVYVPPNASDRFKWTVGGTVGASSLAAGIFVSSWNTAWNTPSEWGASWSGFGKRFGSREAQMTISNAIEAGIGAAWGEDPRYLRSGRAGSWSRTGYAAKTVFVAHRRNGRLAPAWARYLGGIGSNVVANTWLPASDTTASDNIRRIGSGFLGRFVGNLWTEFWPDVRSRFTERE
jgi:hypothetical protein